MFSSQQLKPIFSRIERIKSSNILYNSLISIRDVDLLKEKTRKHFEKNKQVPYLCAIKDNIATKEQEATTCGSKMLENYVSPFLSTVVSILEGETTDGNSNRVDKPSVIIGKSNLDQFGMGSGTTNTIYGPTTNPLFKNEKHISGGSSGGSAAIVADGICDFAIGTDTGGSIRLPAHYCGVIGFKPSYGRISRWGVVAYAQSFDTVGILAKDVDTVSDIYSQLNQYDPKDPTSLSNELRKKIKDMVNVVNNQGKLKVGLIQETNVEGVSQDVSTSFKEVIETLFEKEHSIIPVSLPSIKDSLPVYYTLALAEASSNLARYDGIRYGYHSENKKKKKKKKNNSSK